MMKPRSRFSSSLTAFLALFALGAFPTLSQLSGTPVTSAFSGRSGTDRTLSKPASENQGIFGVVVAEKSDDPCFLEAKFRNLSDGSEGTSRSFDGCSDGSAQGTQSSRRTVSLPAGSLVTGVRICLNSGRDKLKGIQLIGRRDGCIMGEDFIYLAPTQCSSYTKRTFFLFTTEYRLCSTSVPGAVAVDCTEARAGVSSYVERTNCPGSDRGPDGDWENTVSCPAQTVATGIKLSTRSSGGGRTMIDGVALECHPVGSS